MPNHPHWLLRRSDQLAVAGLVVCALAATVGWWLWHGGHEGQLVEIDQAESVVARFSVDINTADWPELVQLPGIGETLAKRIIAVRAEDGPFSAHEDLLRINGIGLKKLESIRPYLRPMLAEENATSDTAAHD